MPAMKDDVALLPETVTARIHPISSPAVDRNAPVRIKTILVPLDFSRESFRVLEYSIVLARKFGATIHVVHVRPSKEVSAIERAENLLLNYTDAVAFLQDRLSDVEQQHDLQFSPEHCHVFSGRPFEEICRVAREIEADLIILATRGHGGLRRVVLGSTAERVIRYAPCPVLIPRGKCYRATLANLDRNRVAIRQILVPVDFSDSSIAGVRCAIYLADAFKARLHLLHAVYPHAEASGQDRVSANLLSVAAAGQLAAGKEMKDFKRRHIPGSVACATEVRTGYPIDQICEESGRPGIDLVVLSTHGRTGLRHALLGSVAEHVARYAVCPVLIVPSKRRT
jgi:nucleotide-binding universal stress UspA family protein